MQERISLRAQIYWLCWEICTYPLNKAPPKTLKHQLTVMLFCRQRRNDNSDIMTVTMNHHSIITDAYYLAVFCWRVLQAHLRKQYFLEPVTCISLIMSTVFLYLWDSPVVITKAGAVYSPPTCALVSFVGGQVRLFFPGVTILGSQPSDIVENC